MRGVLLVSLETNLKRGALNTCLPRSMYGLFPEGVQSEMPGSDFAAPRHLVFSFWSLTHVHGLLCLACCLFLAVFVACSFLCLASCFPPPGHKDPRHPPGQFCLRFPPKSHDPPVENRAWPFFETLRPLPRIMCRSGCG